MPNRIWLCGDTHMHSSISDGKYTPDELIEKCKTKGLDWIIITDHNKNAVGDKSYYSENLLVIPGAEYTGRNGHMNIYGSGLPNLTARARRNTNSIFQCPLSLIQTDARCQ